MNNAHQSLERHHAQLLIALRDTGQLGRAAEALSITASAASHRLREAERRLGVTLAEPHGRSLRLTPSGLHLADVAAAAETTLRAGEETARWLDTTARPTVRLALGFHDTVPWIAALAADDRLEFRVDVVRVAYGTDADAVVRRTADLAIVLASGAAPPGDVVAHDELAAVVPPNHPAIERGRLAPDDVAVATYLTAGGAPTFGFEHSEFLAPAGVLPHELVMVESVSLIVQLVAAGRGISIQPRRALERAERVAVLPLTGDGVPVRWEAATRPADEPNTTAAIDAIRSGLNSDWQNHAPIEPIGQTRGDG